MKKILFIVASTKQVGVSVHCLNLFREIHHLYDIKLLVESEGWLTNKIKEESLNVAIDITPGRLSTVGILKSSIYLINKIKKERIDIIHTHGRYPLFLMLFPIFLKKIKNIKFKLISTQHQFIDLADVGFYGIKKKLEMLLMRKCDKVVSVSHDLNDETRNIVNNNKAIEIKNFSPVNTYLNKKKNNKIIKILMIGRLSKEKGFESMIKPLSDLSRKRYFECDIYGDGPLKTELENSIITISNIKLKGCEDNLFSKMVEYDFVIIPSYSESFSLVAVEAMLSKVIVIGRDIPGLNNVIKNNVNGFLFKNDNDVINIIEDVFENKKQLNLFRDNAYKFAIDNYTFTSVKDDFYELYE